MVIDVVKGKYLTHVVIKQFPVLNPRTLRPWRGADTLPWMYFSAKRYTISGALPKVTTEGKMNVRKDSLPVVLKFADTLRLWDNSYYEFMVDDRLNSSRPITMFEFGLYNNFPNTPGPWVISKDSFIIEVHSILVR